MQPTENKRPGSVLIAEISAIREIRPRFPSTSHPPLLKRATRKLENGANHANSVTSKFLIDNFTHVLAASRLLATRHSPLATFISNRHTYEKLEVELRHLLSAKVPVLIDTKTHFIQGKNAQFQCTNPKSAQAQEGGFLSTRRLSADPVRFAVACSPLVTRH